MGVDVTDDPEDDPVVRRIKQAMRDKRVTQAELARVMRRDKGTINAYMKGKLKPTKALPDIAKALDVTVDWLLGGDEDGPPPDDARAAIIEGFVVGPIAAARGITPAEARWLRAWPYLDVSEGALLNALDGARRGLSPADAVRSAATTASVQAQADALGVPRKEGR